VAGDSLRVVPRRLSRPERDKACDRLERFVLRARRVMAHSLYREHMDLLQEVADGTFKIKTIKNTETGDYEQRLLMELPPEEAFESFAARLRPFTIRDEPVYWENVLDAIEGLTPQETLDEVIDIGQLREAWAGVTQGKKTAQAYYVITQNGQLTDKQLAEDWLNSDALHAQVINSAVGNDLDLDERYQAAAGVYARLGAAVNSTYIVIKHLVDEGPLNLSKDVFTKPVTATTSIDVPLVGGYSAPAGSTAMPTDLVDPLDLNPEAWRPIYEQFEQIIKAKEEAEAKAKEGEANQCPHCRGTGGVQIRLPYTSFASMYDVYLAKQWSR
jgi:hypothetical protein